MTTSSRTWQPAQVIPMYSATEAELDATGALVEYPGSEDLAAWADVHDLVCRLVAPRHLVAHYTDGQRRGTRVYLYSPQPDGQVLVVVDNGSILIKPYLAPDMESAVIAARGIIGCGGGYNW